MPKLSLIIGACVLLGLAAIALWLDRSTSAIAPIPTQSATAIHEVAASTGAVYSAKFIDLHGNEQTLGQWDRKVLVVNFWATWCGPCKEEMPILAKLQAKFGEQNLQIVGIAADSRANVANFAKNVQINYPVFIDEGGAIEFSKRLGNRLGLLPHTVVFSPGGTIIFNKLGAITEVELGEILGQNTSIVR